MSYRVEVGVVALATVLAGGAVVKESALTTGSADREAGVPTSETHAWGLPILRLPHGLLGKPRLHRQAPPGLCTRITSCNYVEYPYADLA
jgi:hypothetical protein